MRLTYTPRGYIMAVMKGRNLLFVGIQQCRCGQNMPADCGKDMVIRMEKNPQEGKCGCHSVKKKDRQEKEYKDLIHRLNRIEGQIRGIKGMVEEDRYCTDILIQVAAVNAALNSFNKVLLANHIRSCVVNDIKEGKEETIDELVETLQKVMK